MVINVFHSNCHGAESVAFLGSTIWDFVPSTSKTFDNREFLKNFVKKSKHKIISSPGLFRVHAGDVAFKAKIWLFL